MNDLFLSYHSADRQLVRELQRLLAARGLTTFLDRDNLVPGLPWPQALEQGLRESRAVTVLIGRDGLGSWQKKEMYLALLLQEEAEKQERAFPVIPVLLPGVTDPGSGFLFLNTWVDLRNGLEDEAGIGLLLRALSGGAPVDRPEIRISPYRGLRFFREDDAAFFCGRENAARELLELVLRRDLVALVGSSGSGKSSLAQAGLLPLLRRQRLPDGVWDAVCFSPGARPFRSLARALLPLLASELSEVDRQREARKLADELGAAAEEVEETLRRCLEKWPGTDRLLLIVDQLEELFTEAREEDRGSFLTSLLLAQQRLPLTILFTLRADFYDVVTGFDPALGKRILLGQMNLGAMTREELGQAIAKPARRVGLTFEPGLVDRILDDSGEEPGTLPLVEFALDALWERRQSGTLTHSAYEEIGKVAGAIAATADGFVAALPPEEQPSVRRIFTRLVRVSPLEEGGRRSRQRIHLDTLSALEQEVARKLATEKGRRLLVLGRDGTAETVTLAHEALIHHWQRLQGWLVEDQELLLWRQRLQSSLEQWKAAGREEGALLHGALLSEAERWLRERPGELSAEQEKLIRDSASLRKRVREEEENRRQHDLEQKQARADEQGRRAEERGRANRRLKLALAGLAVLLAVLVVLGLRLAVTQRAALRQSQRATARYLSSQVPAVFANRHQTALLLAIEAFRLTRSAGEPRFPPVEQALRQTLTVFGGSALGSYPGPYRRIVASPDHTFGAGLGKDGKVRVWNLSSSDPAKTEQVFDGVDGEPGRFEISPGNRWLLLATGDKRRLLLRSLDGRMESREIRLQSPLVLAVFSADDHWFGLRATGEALRVFDLAASGFSKRQDHGPIEWSDLTSRKGHGGIGPDSALEVIRSGHFVKSVGDDRFACLWETPQRVFLRKTDLVETIRDPVMTLVGDWFTIGETPQRVFVRKTDLGGHDDTVRVLGIGANESWLLTSGSAGQPPRLWNLRGDPASPAEPGRLSHGTARSADDPLRHALARVTEPWPAEKSVLSEDHRWLANGLTLLPGESSAAVHLWDLRPPAPALKELRSHRGVGALTFSPDGRLLVTGGKEGVIRIYHLQPTVNETPVVLEPGGGEITAAAFSPDGRRLAVAAGDRIVRLWRNPADFGKGVPPDLRLEGALEPLTSLAFGPGAWLAAGGRDGTVYLWDQELYPRPPIAVKKYPGAIHALSFSGDGRWLVSTQGIATLRWRMREDELEQFACQTVGRNLSRKEWDDYFPGETYRRTCPGLPPGD